MEERTNRSTGQLRAGASACTGCLTITHSHTLIITCTCCYDETKGTQDQDLLSCSFSDSLFLSFLSLYRFSALSNAFPHSLSLGNVEPIGSDCCSVLCCSGATTAIQRSLRHQQQLGIAQSINDMDQVDRFKFITKGKFMTNICDRFELNRTLSAHRFRLHNALSP